MFDIGWSELLVIGVVALIVVGPKDLPGMFRTAGQFVGKIRGMAREFTSAMNQAADDAGVSDMKNTLSKATSLKNTGLDSVTESMRNYAKNYVDPTTIGAPSSVKPSTDAAKVTAAKSVSSAGKKAATKTKAVKATAAKTATAKPAAAKTAKAKATKPKAVPKEVKAKPAKKAVAKTATKPAPTIRAQENGR